MWWRTYQQDLLCYILWRDNTLGQLLFRQRIVARTSVAATPRPYSNINKQNPKCHKRNSSKLVSITSLQRPEPCPIFLMRDELSFSISILGLAPSKFQLYTLIVWDKSTSAAIAKCRILKWIITCNNKAIIQRLVLWFFYKSFRNKFI